MSYIQRLRQLIGPRKAVVAFATAIVRDAAGRILFQRRSDFGWWGLPGGILEVGETLSACAAREVWEETGLRVVPWRLLGIYTGPQYDVVYPNGDQVQQWTATFECYLTGNELRTQGSETLATAFFEPANLPSTSSWYTAMLRDLLSGRVAASFEPPRATPPDGQGEYVMQLRAQVGKERIIVPGAVMLIRNEAGHVLCLQRSDNGRWQLPAGFIDLGESIAETAVREVREETGLEIELVRVIGAYAGEEDQVTYDNGDPVQNCSTFFECRITGGHLRLDPSENRALGYFPPGALPETVPVRWQQRVKRALENTPDADFD